MRQPRAAVRRGPLARLAAAAVVVAFVTAGCSGSSDETEPEPVPSDTPLGDVDLTGVVAERDAFCDALSSESVAPVIGGEPEETDEYTSGQEVLVAPGLQDVAHEYSCYFERGSGKSARTARAWLFAQPADAADAKEWIKERSADEACRPAGELEFGSPGLVQSCDQDTRRRVTAVGLFGDGWLTCQSTAPLSVDADELLEETQRWCAGVAQSTASSS